MLSKSDNFMCHGKQFKRKIQQTVVGVGYGWGNSSSKAFDISFADRPKAKTTKRKRFRDRRATFTTVYVVGW
jgi:hypothetical protein